MKSLIIAISMAGILAATAQDEEPKELTQARTAYQAQLKFAAQSYLQKLEGLRKTAARPKNQADAIQAEITRFKRQIANEEEATVPDPAAPDKPGVKAADIKAGRITEFPKELTAADWDKLPGKVIKVNAAEEAYYGKDPVTVKDNENFYAVPHPTDRWNLSKKVSCTWEGISNDKAGFSSSMIGKLTMYVTKSDAKQQSASWHNMDIKTMIEGPVRVGFSSGYSYDQFPKIYYKGEIRVKLVPAE